MQSSQPLQVSVSIRTVPTERAIGSASSRRGGCAGHRRSAARSRIAGSGPRPRGSASEEIRDRLDAGTEAGDVRREGVLAIRGEETFEGILETRDGDDIG